MTTIAKLLAAAALAGTAAAPAAAQYPYPYPQQTYPYPGQPYGGTVVDQVIGSLLGNRYNVTDRGAISRCASAAMVQAQNQYRGGYGQGYQQGYGYGQAIVAPNMRVTAITDVERRSNGLRVRGLIDSGGGYGAYGQGYGGYGGYGQTSTRGDLSFRCTVDYRGYVSDIRIRPNTDYRRY